MKFEALYLEYKNLVFNLALQYVQNIEDAEEITQDTFVSVHFSLNSFKADSKISTWIYRIAINKSLDFLKSKKRKKRFGYLTSIFFDDSSELKYDVPFFNHPGVQLESKEDLQDIFKKINELPERQKTALILNKIEKLKLNEIADIMNLKPKAVESLVQRAKVNLSKKISDK
jgi:RNA polymerase sigma-70 factor (ECF subfamily)